MGFLGLIGFGGGATGLGLGGGGANNDPNGHVATGGVISDYSTPTAAYRAHIFNTPGDFVISELSSEFPAHVEYLVMGGGAGGGGGGGGSQAAGGGGGAGGMKNNIEGPGGGGDNPNSAYPSGYPVSAATFEVVVGRGGDRGMRSGSLTPAQPMGRAKGGAGKDSYFGPSPARVQATGGGQGGAGRANSPGLSPGGDGGCGGGGGFTAPGWSWGGTCNRNTGGTPFPGPAQGYGSSPVGATGPAYSGPGAAGGGSGVGGNGGNAPGDPTVEAKGGVGGAGKASVIAYGPTVPLFYGGGGAGGSAPPTGGIDQQPLGGSSIGGEGASKRFKPSYSAPDYLAEVQKSVFASNQRDNTGSGGGGGGTGGANENCPGGNGADGVVVVRYQIGQSDATESRKATGGAVSVYNNKIIHTILYTQNFVTTSAITGAEIFAVGGGGGGGGGNGSCGGGGAGGVVTITDVAFDSGVTYTCTIGHGGQGGYRGDYRGFNGENTTMAYTSGGPSPAFLGTITAKGGGYGGGYGPPVRNGGNGGCGGGSASDGTEGEGNQADADNPAYPSPKVTSAGYDGGDAHNPNHRGGGGGGAGGVGSGGADPGPRNGGIGVQIPTTFRDPAQLGIGMAGSPTDNWYVAGGGGGGCEAGTPNAEEPSDHGKGGAGTGDTGPWSGGGQGGSNTATPGDAWISAPTSGYNGEPGYNNTGGGGGGGWWTDPGVGNAPWGYQGGNGGSGIILIAYPK